MNTRLETTFLGAALAAFASPAVAAIDACVSSAAELSQQFQLAQVSGQDITLKVVRGTYDIAGTSLVRTDSAGPALMQSVRVLGGYAPGCATRTVDPANTIFTSSSSTSVYWRTTGTLVSIEGISFVGNGTRLSIWSRDGDVPVTFDLRRNIFRAYVPAGGSEDRVGLNVVNPVPGSRVRIENNLFHANFADAVLGVTAREQAEVGPLDISITHNTIVSNVATSGICIATSLSAILANNVVRGHGFDMDTECTVVAGVVAGVRLLNNSLQTRRFQVPPLIETATSAADPQFVDAGGDFHLQDGSPAINSGSSASTISLPGSDIEGNLRYQGQAPDRGAYESPNTGLFAQTVSNTNDSGAGSLRQAILGANGTPGQNLIVFDIPGACPRTINLASALPEITDSLLIDAMTQPGSAYNSDDRADNATRCVIVRPATANAIARGFSVPVGAASATQLGITGIAMGGFGTAAIDLVGGGSHHVEGSQFGGSVGGSTLPANATSIHLGGNAGSRIGGSDERQRNVIGGATVAGISLELTSGNGVFNNLIGLAPNGRFALPNAIGIRMNAASATHIVDNVISGNDNGIALLESSAGFGSSNNVIGGNRIGLRAVPLVIGGTTDYRLGNTFNGLLVQASASATGNAFGYCLAAVNGIATFYGAANTIAWNGTATNSAGIRVSAGRGLCIAGNTVHGNNGASGQQVDIGTQGIDAIDNDSAPGTDALGNRGINAPVLLDVGGGDTQGVALLRLQSRNGLYRVSVYSRAGGCIDGTDQGEADVEHTDLTYVSIASATAGFDGLAQVPIPISVVGSQSTLTGRAFVAQVQRVPSPIGEPADASELGNCILYTLRDSIFEDGFDP